MKNLLFNTLRECRLNNIASPHHKVPHGKFTMQAPLPLQVQLWTNEWSGKTLGLPTGNGTLRSLAKNTLMSTKLQQVAFIYSEPNAAVEWSQSLVLYRNVYADNARTFYENQNKIIVLHMKYVS